MPIKLNDDSGLVCIIVNMTAMFVESDSTIGQLRVQLLDVNERLRNASLSEFGIVASRHYNLDILQ